MATDIFSITSSALPADAHVVGFKGREGLSKVYGFEIGFRTEDAAFNQDDAVMAAATFELGLEEGAPPFRYHGILAAVELLHEFDGKMLYRALLVPRLWQLTLTRHSNVWTDKSLKQIIEEVLQWSGITAYELRLDGSYQPREYVAQYKEDNLAFISRWMEYYGMYYFFEQGDGTETLVITDAKSFDESDPNAIPTVRYKPLQEGDVMALEAFDVFRAKSSALPASIELLDYDYNRPTLDVRATSPVVNNGLGELSFFGDDRFASPDEGKKLADVRAEAQRARQKVFNGRGRVFHMAAGTAFTLDEHPKEDFNKTFLVTETRHYGNQSAQHPKFKELLGLDSEQEYVCEVTAIRSNVQYRHPMQTPWPRVEGYESATVCGEAQSDYAQIDDQGRYKCRFKFDESDLGGGKASCWIRMQQPYAGGNEGFHFPLLKNTEVLVFFLGGDVDRPVISGAIPNALTPSPVTVNNHTQNIIQTVNLNLIKIEDTLTQQFIFVQCPVQNTYFHFGVEVEGFNLVLNTDGHVHFNFGGDQVIDIALTLTENVGLDVTFNYNQSWLVNITNDWRLECMGLQWHHIVGSVEIYYDSDHYLCIGGVSIVEITGTLDVTVTGKVTETFESGHKLDVTGNQDITITGDQNITITGKQNIDVQSDWKWNVLGHEIQIKSANSTEITFGLKNEAFIGMKNGLHVGLANDIFVGGKGEIFVGQKRAIAVAGELSMFLGMKMEMALGLFMSLRAGAFIEVDGAVDLKTKSASIQSMAAYLETKATRLSTSAVDLFL